MQDKHSEKQENPYSGMGQRGTTRPVMRHDQDSKSNKDKSEEKHSHHSMGKEQRMHMLQMHHKQTLWVYWTIVLLGFWQIVFPFTFGYDVSTVEPSGGREVWLSLSQRIAAMKWSDIISGILLIFFGWRSLKPNRPVSLWIVCFIGVWLSIAPLLFWSPTAVGYLNATFVGALIICLSILIPGMPNMIMYMKMGSEVPQGWSYNPSSWPQRWIMMATGFAGWLVSRYLGAYQLGYIDTIFDPFFGEGSRLVLDSDMSHSLPISDGGLGSLAYTFEFLMGWMGAPSRWRTMPWMVTLFGILVIPLGLVHIFLVISQPIVVGEWCTFCLLAAAIMLPMIPLEIDEVIAMGQHMVQANRRGENMWKVFWKGGKPAEENSDERSPQLAQLNDKPAEVFKASIWGMSFPWTLVLATILGIWLVCAPAVFGRPVQAPVSDVNHLCGSLVVVISVVCMGEVVRAGRWLNVPIALAIAALPWIMGDPPMMMKITNVVAGMLIALLSIPRGVIKEQYGLWDKFVK